MKLNLPPISQNFSRWASKKLGTSTVTTIGNYDRFLLSSRVIAKKPFFRGLVSASERAINIRICLPFGNIETKQFPTKLASSLSTTLANVLASFCHKIVVTYSTFVEKNIFLFPVGVLRGVFKENKVLDSVVSFIPIHMMDLFGRIKRTPQIFLHHKTVLIDITTSVCRRALGEFFIYSQQNAVLFPLSNSSGDLPLLS